jgi:hypothetical protein
VIPANGFIFEAYCRRGVSLILSVDAYQEGRAAIVDGEFRMDFGCRTKRFREAFELPTALQAGTLIARRLLTPPELFSETRVWETLDPLRSYLQDDLLPRVLAGPPVSELDAVELADRLEALIRSGRRYSFAGPHMTFADLFGAN